MLGYFYAWNKVAFNRFIASTYRKKADRITRAAVGGDGPEHLGKTPAC